MSNWGPQITNVDNRPWYKKPLGIAGIVGGILVIGGVAAAAGGGGGDDNASPPPTKHATSAHAGSKSSAAAPTSTAPAPAPTWKTVTKLRGDTNGAGSDFHLNGCETRLTYDVKGDAIVAFYVVESGKQLMKEGGFPVAQPTKPGPGETELHEDAGDYYLDVIAANGSWSAKVQEKC